MFDDLSESLSGTDPLFDDSESDELLRKSNSKNSIDNPKDKDESNKLGNNSQLEKESSSNKNDCNSSKEEKNKNNVPNEDKNFIELSDSNSKDGDLKIITQKEYLKPFQEKYTEKPKIQVLYDNPKNKNTNILFESKDFKGKNKKVDVKKQVLKTFFTPRNNKLNQSAQNISINNFSNRNNSNFNIKQNNNKNNKNRFNRYEKKVRETKSPFRPLQSQYYRGNNFKCLYIERIENQILTDIYNQYNNKKEFKDETFYQIFTIKTLICTKGPKTAIEYIQSFKDPNKKIRLFNEACYFFKEIINQEISSANHNGGNIVLIESKYNCKNLKNDANNNERGGENKNIRNDIRDSKKISLEDFN